MPTKIIMPQLGESVVEGTISRWLKQEGDAIEEMDSLLEVSTDKVDTEIPSPASGTLLKILVPEGETVNAGTIIAWIGAPGEVLPAGETPAGETPAGEAPAQAAHVPDQPADRAPEVAEPGAGKSAEAITEAHAAPTVDGEPAVRDDPAVQAEPAASVSTVPAPGRSRELGFISPIVARLAQEHSLDLNQVPGTGEGGRITKKDVLTYLERQPGDQPAAQEPAAGSQTVAQVSEATEAAPWETPADGDLFRPTEMVFGAGRPGAKPAASQPAVGSQPAAASLPEEETRPITAQPATQPAAAELPADGQLIPHSKMRRSIAEHMVASKRTSPHVTTVMEVDLQRVIAHYQASKAAFARDGARLTYTAYFVAATVQALRAYPLVNSSWTEEGIRLHPHINLGLAVSLGEKGLIVPVLKAADGLSLIGLARAISDLAERARSQRLAPDEVRGGTFTITNHGISGSLFATPIINQPQCGILGVGAIQKRVVVLEDSSGGDAIAIRPMAYLSFTFDHRILDGASADGFLSAVIAALQNWQ